MRVSTRRTVLAGLGLVLLTLLIYLPALDFGFVDFDDPLYVTDNLHVQQGLHWDNVVWAFGGFHVANYHPLTLLSHMLDVELFALEARGHHLTSILWHAANAVLLFFVLRSLTRQREEDGGRVFWPSLWVAVLFAAHPLRVESVAWIAERKDVLSGFFFIATLGLYGAWCRQPSPVRYLALLASAVLGLLAKPMLVTLPCVLLLLDVWPLRRLPLDSWRAALRRLPPLIGEKIPLFALAGVFSVLTVLAQGNAVVTLEHQPLGFRLQNAVVSWTAYLEKTLVPRDLAFFYPLPDAISPARLAFGLAILGVISILAIGARRRMPWLLVGWLWFLGTLVPVIGLFQVGDQAMADRYTYLPQIGLFIAAAWGLAALARERPASAKPIVALALSAALALAVAARAQVGVWRDNETLFGHAVAVAPSVKAHLNLAETLRATGRPRAAMEHYHRALEIEPRWAEIHAGLAQTHLVFQEIPRAVEAARRAVALASHDPRFYHVLAVALERGGDVGGAIEQLEKAVELDPRMIPAHVGLADLHRRRGDAERSRFHLERARESAGAIPGERSAPPE